MMFNPQQQFMLLQKLGYRGNPDQEDMEKFLASNPAAAVKMGQYSQVAQQRLAGKPMPTQAMANGGVVTKALNVASQISRGLTRKQKGEAAKAEQATANGGVVTAEQATANLQPAKEKLAGAQKSLTDIQSKLAQDPENTDLQKQLDEATKNLTSASTEYAGAQGAFQTVAVPKVGEVTTQAVKTPEELIKTAEVEKLQEKPEEILKEGTGQVAPKAPTVDTAKVEEVEEAEGPKEITAETIEATKVSDEVKKELDDLEAAKGTVSKEGTVRGQLEILMEDFEKDGTPPWASGAMRKTMGIMQSRGLGASSIAGQAITQAALESAISVAERDAATVAQFEMQNLNNEQQTLIFKTQQRMSSMLSDQAADNAAKQFNAASENQTKQFMTQLESNVSKFNTEQVNAIRQFNAGQENAIEQFNAQIQNQRDQFNAQNSLVISQANAKWRQDIATMNTAAQNEANMQAAKTMNGLTSTALDQIWQRERDLMAFAFTASESSADRATRLLIADMDSDLAKSKLKSDEKGSMVAALLKGADLVGKALNWW